MMRQTFGDYKKLMKKLGPVKKNDFLKAQEQKKKQIEAQKAKEDK